MKHIRLIVGVPLIAVGAYFLFRTIVGSGEASTQRVIVNALAIVLLSGIMYVLLKPSSTKRQSTMPNPASNLQPDSGPTPEATVVTSNQHTPSTTIASDQPLAATVQPEASVLKNQPDAPSQQSVIVAREIIYATRVVVVCFILGVVTFLGLWIGLFNGWKYVKPDYSDVYMRYDSTVDQKALLEAFFPLTNMGMSEALGLQGIIFERKYNPEFDSLYRERLRIGKTSAPALEKAWREVVAKRRYSITHPTSEAMALYAREFPSLTTDVELRPVLGKWRGEYLDAGYLDESQTTEALRSHVDYIIKERRLTEVKKSLYIALAVFLTTFILWIGGRYVAKATHWVKTTAKYNDNQQQ